MAKKKKLRVRTRVEQNAFVKGLITESTPLNFPDNASLAESNFVLNRDGSRQRRLGLDKELGSLDTLVPSSVNTDKHITSFTWKNASNNRNFDIAVVQVDDRLYFFDGNVDPVSANPINGGLFVQIPVPEFQLPSGEVIIGDIDFSYASVHGHLIVVNGGTDVYILDFNLNDHLDNSKEQSIFITNNALTIRDLFGIDEPGVASDLRQTTLSADHEYNLRNQGWLPELKSAYKGTVAAGLKDTIQYTFTSLEGDTGETGIYPSNADMVWANKVGGGAAGVSSIGAYDPYELLKATYGKQEAPKGRYIIDVFDRGASRINQLALDGGSTLDPAINGLDNTIGGITSVTSYMGRAVYALSEVYIDGSDEKSPSLGSMILFSQAGETKRDLVRCHSKLDPTAGEEFSPLATDGGFVAISGLGRVNSLQEHGNSLFVFSDRGVWQINGGDRLFTPTNVNVNKITNVGSIGTETTVSVEDKVSYLSDGGIYLITNIGQESKQAVTNNITTDTIQTLYDSIDTTKKANSSVYYDRFTRQIKWLFATNNDLPNQHFYDTEIVLDLNLNAFFVHNIGAIQPDLSGSVIGGNDAPYVIGFLERPSLLSQNDGNLVVVNGVPVTDMFGENVVITKRHSANEVESSNKYWVAGQNEDVPYISVVEYNETKFRDWFSFDDEGIDASAFLLTGSATAGESATFKRIPYITTHMRRTEEALTINEDGSFIADNPSSCSLQVQWEWTDSPEGGRWSNPQEIYRLPRTFVADAGSFEYSFPVITTKTRLRGKGRAFSLLYKTKPLHDCVLYGWSLELDAEVSV